MTNIANKLQAEKLYSIDSICWALDLVVNRQNLKATRAQLRAETRSGAIRTIHTVSLGTVYAKN